MRKTNPKLARRSLPELSTAHDHGEQKQRRMKRRQGEAKAYMALVNTPLLPCQPHLASLSPWVPAPYLAAYVALTDRMTIPPCNWSTLVVRGHAMPLFGPCLRFSVKPRNGHDL